jgi:hypothetical protein
MSELGQKAKYSLGADVFRFAPESGLNSGIAPCPKGATTGLRRLSAVTSRASSVQSFATAIRASEQMILAAETWYRTANLGYMALGSIGSKCLLGRHDL